MVRSHSLQGTGARTGTGNGKMGLYILCRTVHIAGDRDGDRDWDQGWEI